MINVLFVLMSSVKWGHLGNFELNSKTQFSRLKILCGHLGHFEPDSIFH